MIATSYTPLEHCILAASSTIPGEGMQKSHDGRQYIPVTARVGPTFRAHLQLSLGSLLFEVSIG